MKSNLNNKNRAYLTLLIVGLVALAFWYYSDAFSSWAATSNIWLVMFVSIILNPAYLVLIYWLWKEYSIRGIIAGLLFSLAVDIVSLTHSIGKLGILPIGESANSLYGYSDTLFYKLIYPHFNGAIAVFVLYVVFPIGLIYLALRVIRRTASFNKIVKESI